jgi:hypothetical protein
LAIHAAAGNSKPTQEEFSELIMLLETQSRNSTQEGFCRLTASARVLPAYSVLRRLDKGFRRLPMSFSGRVVFLDAETHDG